MDSTDSVSVVALVVSVVALIGAILQLLQQYYSSAEGYSNCSDAVMGEWALMRKRKFHLSELRFEVLFETPVIFMCPPSNKRGPLGQNRPLWHVQGTSQSEADTSIPSVQTENQRKDSLKGSTKLNEDVHTADNDRANWFILLQAMQAMERESLSWQQATLELERQALGPKLSVDLPGEVASWNQHTIVTALQPKRKSYDTMPSSVKKPYATSTICHMVEMAAMLGLRWRDFDRANHKYHAEGNGYLLTGKYVDDLGIMFSFQIYGQNTFGRQRVIPNDEIKLMAFGNVSTIHRPMVGPTAYQKPSDDNEDLRSSGVLQFGSTAELIETLTHYGCNSKTTNYFCDDKKKHSHLFPVVFELLGMVASPVYIPNTYYRYLPNPTTYSWNRKRFSMRKLLREFVKSMKPDSEYLVHTHHMLELLSWGEELDTHLKNWADEDVFPLSLLHSLHACIKKCDNYLTPPEQSLNERMVTMTKLVVREHVQEVMKLLNDVSGTGINDDSRTAFKDGQRGHGDGTHITAFEELNSAAPETRQAKLMEIYFTFVRRSVADNVPHTLRKRHTGAYVPSVASRSNLSLDTLNDDVKASIQRPEIPRMLIPKPESELQKLRQKSGIEADAQFAEEIWCTIVFRMLCWLLLHDFHKKDVQISKSELFGSRLPVYIA